MIDNIVVMMDGLDELLFSMRPSFLWDKDE